MLHERLAAPSYSDICNILARYSNIIPSIKAISMRVNFSPVNLIFVRWRGNMVNTGCCFAPSFLFVVAVVLCKCDLLMQMPQLATQVRLADVESDSLNSEDMSNTDSGRGPSELDETRQVARLSVCGKFKPTSIYTSFHS